MRLSLNLDSVARFIIPVCVVILLAAFVALSISWLVDTPSSLIRQATKESVEGQTVTYDIRGMAGKLYCQSVRGVCVCWRDHEYGFSQMGARLCLTSLVPTERNTSDGSY